MARGLGRASVAGPYSLMAYVYHLSLYHVKGYNRQFTNFACPAHSMVSRRSDLQDNGNQIANPVLSIVCSTLPDLDDKRFGNRDRVSYTCVVSFTLREVERKSGVLWFHIAGAIDILLQLTIIAIADV